MIEPIQPWSAAGAEKPILIFSPVAAAEVAAADSPPALVAAAAVVAAADVVLDDELDELVHADSTNAAAPTTVMVRSIGRVRPEAVRAGWEAERARDRRDMWC
ncbi:MAG TPA: hypothetical protein VIU87_14965, partial [Mycobacterium sp.]